MNRQQLIASAEASHHAALRRVAETPPPVQQKFAPGARVNLAATLAPYMSHFPAGKRATVKYTYAHAHGIVNELTLRLYCLDVDGVGSVAWYYEDQLSALSD